MRKKVISRLNIVKILSHSSWSLDKKTLLQIYTSLVRSVLDYSFFIEKSISEANHKILKAVQNNAIRSIYRLDRDTHTEDLLRISGLSSIKVRFYELGRSYIQAFIENGNPLMQKLFSEYDTFVLNLRGSLMADKLQSMPTFLCEHHRLFNRVVTRRRAT